MWERTKSAALAVCIGLLAAYAIVWKNTICQWAGAVIIIHVLWVIFITVDETNRERKKQWKSRR